MNTIIISTDLHYILAIQISENILVKKFSRDINRFNTFSSAEWYESKELIN